MLTQAELGLTTDEYNALKSQEIHHAFKVIAHKANLQFDDSGTYPLSPWMVWDGADYIFWVTPSFIPGSTDLYDEIEVYRYSISGGTNTLVYTVVSADIGVIQSVSLTNPAIGMAGSNPCVFFATNRSGFPTQETVWRFKLSTNGASFVSSDTHHITVGSVPYFDLLNYQTLQSVVDENVDPYPAFTVSSTVAGGHPIEHAFDNLSSTYFGFNALTGSIQFDDLNGNKGNVLGVMKYAITVDATTTNTPRTWTLDRWNGSTWVNLDTQTNLTWTAGQRREFVLTSPAYGRVRINVTAANGANPRFREIELWAQEGIAPNPSAAYTSRIGHMDATRDLVFYSYSEAGNHLIAGYSFDNPLEFLTMYGSFLERPTSLSVLTTNDQYEHLVAITIPYNGSIIAEADGANVLKSYQANSSLIVMRGSTDPDTSIIANGGMFGETVVDSTPGDMANGRFSNAHLLFANDFYMLTVSAKRLDSGGNGIYLYMSKNGQNWSAAQYIGPDNDLGVSLLSIGDVFVSNQGIADSTILLGNSPAASQEDITDHVHSMELSVDPVLQGTLTLDNADAYFSSHAWINKENLVILECSLGIRPMDEFDEIIPAADPILAPIGNMIIETIGRDQTTPEDMIQVSCRDYLAFASDYVKPLEPRYFNSQYVGFDSYDNITDSNYGGMAHTSIQGGPGEWTTVDGSLIYTPPAAGRGYSIVINTQLQPVYQGVVEVMIPSNSGTAYGVAFRVLDKDNFLAVVTDNTGLNLKIIEVRNGIEREITTYTSAGGTIMNVSFTRANINILQSVGAIVDDHSGLVDTPPSGATIVHQIGDNNPFSQFETYNRDIALTPLTFGYVGLIGR